jgi:hypothetical protein
VLGVGRRSRDLRVTLGCLEAFLRERRIVVEVDEIVRDARVLGLALEDRFQQRRTFELVGIGLVSRGSRNVERDRVGVPSALIQSSTLSSATLSTLSTQQRHWVGTWNDDRGAAPRLGLGPVQKTPTSIMRTFHAISGFIRGESPG